LVPYSGFTVNKWRKSWISPSLGGDYKSVGFSGVIWPVMRYADIVLMYAETENEINNRPTQAAKEALSLIRKRAFSSEQWPSKVTQYVDSVSMSKDDFFNAIVDERAWEFGGEMLRKNDLIRWNLLGTKINEMKTGYLKICSNDPEYTSLVPNYIFWKYAEDGETLDILNPDYRLPSTAITGYTRYNWLPLSSAAQMSNLTNSLHDIALGYDAGLNNYLFPIHNEIISESNGVLSNDQIP
jgi:hypothetical protein